MKKLNIQKIFCFLSFLFILSCCIFYGTRFLTLYLKNKKIEIEEKNSLVKVLREKNQENVNFKVVNGLNYFTNNDESNYLEYSNILWRIIKINSNNSITVISNNSLTSLAYGKNLDYKNSKIYPWLNKTNNNYSGILENSLNKIDTYLEKTSTCTDVLDELTNTPCKEESNDNYLSLLSATDYLNAGGKDSYLINKEYFYLSNTTSEKQIWYITDDGKASYGGGYDILGIRPVINIKANVDYISGDGTKDNPYKIEKEPGMFGSYVKLDNQIWRIYQVNDTEVRLMLNDYLKINNNSLTRNYSNKTSYHDDTSKNSLAYYLNHDFLNTLSYKDKIKEVSWSNGYYNQTNDYDYTTSLDKTINSKVALMSIGNIFLNNTLTNYATMTGQKDKGTTIYTIQANKKLYPKSISIKLNIVPTISLDKSLLTKGNGNIDSPFEME